MYVWNDSWVKDGELWHGFGMEIHWRLVINVGMRFICMASTYWMV